MEPRAMSDTPHPGAFGTTIRRGAVIAVTSIVVGTLAALALPPSLARYLWVVTFVSFCVGLSAILHGVWDGCLARRARHPERNDEGPASVEREDAGTL
jgi:hypothetical protein